MAFTTFLTTIICQTLTNGSRLCFSRANRYIYVLIKKLAALFHLNMSAVEDEILTVQAELPGLQGSWTIWELAHKRKCPNMRKCATSLTALFVIFYLFMRVSLFPHDN